jgi:hypothetical protein
MPKHDYKQATLGDLLSGPSKWLWINCHTETCRHYAPIAIAPYAIRWGMEAPSTVLTSRLRCSRCGGRRLTMTLPSWTGTSGGFESFPVERAP